MIDDYFKVLAKADKSMFLNINKNSQLITRLYYDGKDYCKSNPMTLEEFAKKSSEIFDIIIDNEKMNNVWEIINKEEVFNFPDIYKDNHNKPIKFYFKGGNVDDENIFLYIYKELEDSLDTFDELTKCVSFDFFKKTVEENIKNKTEFISGLINIDNFKEFNEKYNRILGDVVLIETASTIKQCVGNNGLVCRSGGDEFLFFYKISNDYDEVYKYITDMLFKINGANNEIVDVDTTITVTIGLTRHPLDGNKFDLLLNRNRAALIRGKKKARNCFIIYLLEKCGYVDEFTEFDSKVDDLEYVSGSMGLITGVMEILNSKFTLKKRITDSLNLIGLYFYLDRLVVTEVDPKTNKITNTLAWYNPRSLKKEYKPNTKNITLWKSIYEKSNLLVVNSLEEGEGLVISDVLKDSNIVACVATELRQNDLLFGQIRFEMTSINRHWQPSDISNFVMLSKMISIIYNNEYTTLSHYKEMYFDRTTGIYNLQKWVQEGEKFISDISNDVYSVLDVAIHDFVNILNAYGIITIEKILKTIANFLLTLEEDNIVFGRTADNRFSMIFKGKNIEYINSLFIDLKEYVKDNIQLETGNVLLEAGIYINEDKILLEEALDRAIIARKFNSSFDNATVFTSIMYEKELVRLELESHIEQALQDNEFLLYLQPKINTKDKKLAGAEALTRWNYNFEKLIFPDVFIPLLERNGFIAKLDYAVFENVCKLIKELKDNNQEVFPISVNVSRSIPNFDRYLSDLERIRKKYNIEPDYIEIEITEGMYTDNNEIMKDFINKLHKKGYKVSLDDFGSGYSNISALSKLNFDTIKFDRGFFNDIKNEKETMIIKTMVKLVKKLNMKVLCEGVETADYEAYLTEIGCDYIQGYYYDKPLPLETFMKKYIK